MELLPDSAIMIAREIWGGSRILAVMYIQERVPGLNVSAAMGLLDDATHES